MPFPTPYKPRHFLYPAGALVISRWIPTKWNQTLQSCRQTMIVPYVIFAKCPHGYFYIVSPKFSIMASFWFAKLSKSLMKLFFELSVKNNEDDLQQTSPFGGSAREILVRIQSHKIMTASDIAVLSVFPAVLLTVLLFFPFTTLESRVLAIKFIIKTFKKKQAKNV